MFRIRFFTPPVINQDGWRHAGGELVVGDARLCFLIDLTHWDLADYQHQWREGMSRLIRGAPSTALMTAYRGRGGSAHTMWALWREGGHVYVQEHPVVPAELEGPFDPNDPYAHVGERVPAAQHALPIPEWCVAMEHVHAAMLGIRWPESLG